MSPLAMPNRKAPKDSPAWLAWRKGALTVASARREVWRGYRCSSVAKLLHLHYTAYARLCHSYGIGWSHLQRIDMWQLRVLDNELKRRGVDPTSGYWQSRHAA